MATMHYLPHVNGGPPQAVNCAYCGASLEDEKERAAGSFPSGTKFFCKAVDGRLEDSCYLNYRRRFN